MCRLRFLLLLWGLAWGGLSHGQLDRGVVQVETGRGVVRFTVEVAQTPDERRQGLMHREHLDEGHGMWFLFEKPQVVHFWMKNTPLSLDMIFVNRYGRIGWIHRNAVPHSEATISSMVRVLGVLEIEGGEAQALGLRPGQKVSAPGLNGKF